MARAYRSPKTIDFGCEGPAVNLGLWPADVPAGEAARKHMRERIGRLPDCRTVTLPAGMIRMLLGDDHETVPGTEQP